MDNLDRCSPIYRIGAHSRSGINVSVVVVAESYRFFFRIVSFFWNLPSVGTSFCHSTFTRPKGHRGESIHVLTAVAGVLLSKLTVPVCLPPCPCCAALLTHCSVLLRLSSPTVQAASMSGRCVASAAEDVFTVDRLRTVVDDTRKGRRDSHEMDSTVLLGEGQGQV